MGNPSEGRDAVAAAGAACARPAAAGLQSGLIRPRGDRPVRNGRWYVVGSAPPPVVTRCGAGDLSLADLRAAERALGAEWAFVVLPEDPFERPDEPPPPLAALAAAPIYAVIDGELRVVDHHDVRNRAGAVYVSPGYRYTRTGRVIRTAKVRIPAVTPAELRDMLARPAC